MSKYPIERHTLLAKTFLHLDGIGPKAERHLWRNGIENWESLAREAPRFFPGKRLSPLQRSLEASQNAWQRKDLHYFHKALPGDERWRLISGASEDIAYFDIEATGGGMPPGSQSTAIAFLFRGQLYQEYEEEKKRRLIPFILEEAAILCTYNGATYDIPFLSQEFETPFEKAHIDLCPWYRRMGFQGGLKSIQKSLPQLTQRSSLDLDGYDAVRLWRLHEAAVPGALQTLMTYNAEDVLILPDLLSHAYEWERERRPYLGLEKLPPITVPLFHATIDPGIYNYLKRGVPLPEP